MTRISGKFAAIVGVVILLAIIVISILFVYSPRERVPEIIEESYEGVRLYVSRPIGDNLPALIVIHGGKASRKAALGLCKKFASRFLEKGVAVISVDYGESSFGGREVGDILNAIHFAKTRRYIDPSRICLVGKSHGGYLALMAAVYENITCIVDAYGPTDLISIVEYRRSNPGLWAGWSKIFSKTFSECRKIGLNESACLISRSPISYVSRIDEPVLILHGSRDKVVPLNQSIMLVERFVEEGKENYEVRIFGEVGHGFSLLEGKPYEVLIDFLSRHLLLEQTAG